MKLKNLCVFEKVFAHHWQQRPEVLRSIVVLLLLFQFLDAFYSRHVAISDGHGERK